MHSAPTLRSTPSCQEPRGKCRRPCTHPTHPAPTGVFIWKSALVLTFFISDFRSVCLTLHPWYNGCLCLNVIQLTYVTPVPVQVNLSKLPTASPAL